MPQTHQTVTELDQDLCRLKALPQPVVAYGRDLTQGEVLPGYAGTAVRYHSWQCRRPGNEAWWDLVSP